MLEKIYYLALFLIAVCIICGFVFAWRRRSPMALTLTISALVICIAFHTLENSVATGKDELLPVPGTLHSASWLTSNQLKSAVLAIRSLF